MPVAGTDLTKLLSDRVVAIWDAWRQQDVDAHSALLADDYAAVYPDGSVQAGRPTADGMAAAPIAGYDLSGLHAVALAPDVALVTYAAHVQVPRGSSTAHGRFVVSEVWVLDAGGGWKCRHYQGTLSK